MKIFTNNDPEVAKIREQLKDKQIYLIPYCHADHAWMHTRDWHIRRYVAVLERALELLKTRPDFTYFVDSWSELLKPCVEHHPEWIPEIREHLKQGRFAIGGGQWSNLRFCHLNDETTIRNMTYGKRKVHEIFPEARLDAYANLDVGIGHSQVPQLLQLANYPFYFAWRPLRGLDEQGVPRSFVWEGISGDRVTVTRHCYQGWFHAEEFYDKGNGPCDFKSPAVEMDFVVKYAWRRYLEKPATQPGLKTISFNHGGDDNVPHLDAMYGFERNIPAIIEAWNKGGFGHLEYGTPYDVFDAISKEDLPVWKGLLDPAELCYHIARNGTNSAWRFRDIIDREIHLAEFFAAKAAAGNTAYPEEKFDNLWLEFLPWTTHAIEFLFKEDLREAFLSFENSIAQAKLIRKQSLLEMTGDNTENDPRHFTVFNPIPETRNQVVILDIPNVYNHRRQPVVKSPGGEILPMQIAVAGPQARFFITLVELELPPGAATQIDIDWLEEDVKFPDPEPCENLDAKLASDTLKITFKAGKLVKVENLKTGDTVRADGESGLMEPGSLPQDVPAPGWMPDSFADAPLPFEVKSLEITERGPLRSRIIRFGKSGPHFFRQEIDLYKGESQVRVKTAADITHDSTYIVLSNPLDTDAKLTADVPFGVEERDISKIEYGFKGGGNYENVERRIPGIIWGRSWIHSAGTPNSYGLITADGAKYFRDHGNPRRMLHFLACVKPYRDTGWMQFVDTQRVLGRNVFEHALVVGGKDYRTAGMIAKSEFLRTEIPYAPGKVSQIAAAPFEIAPEEVRLSAFYKENGAYLVRMTNMSQEMTATTVTLPFEPASAKLCDFFLKPLPDAAEVTTDGNKFSLKLKPWQIATIKLT